MLNVDSRQDEISALRRKLQEVIVALDQAVQDRQLWQARAERAEATLAHLDQRIAVLNVQLIAQRDELLHLNAELQQQKAEGHG